MAERWLIMGHEATNSGAPRMLLRVLAGVRATRGATWSCEIVLRRGGPLVREFEAFGRVRVLAHPWAAGASLPAGLFRRFYDRPWGQARQFARCLTEWKGSRFDLVYSNTATNGAVLPQLARRGCPIVTHVHELGPVLREFNSPRELAATLRHTGRFIAVSPAVADDLAALGAAAERVTVIPNFLDQLPAEPSTEERRRMRARLGLPADAPVVVGCGHVHAIKGPDLFVELAAKLAAGRTPAPRCVWLGGETDRRLAESLRRDVHRCGLESVVRFVGPVDDTAAWFAASDVVVVSSRIESFSLVALEAAAQGRPVVGFAAARGLEPLLGEEPSLLAPGLDVEAMAARVGGLLDSPALVRQLGERLRARVAERFLAPRRIAEILTIIAGLQEAPARRHE